jgi:hypothetical protein
MIAMHRALWRRLRGHARQSEGVPNYYLSWIKSSHDHIIIEHYDLVNKKRNMV